MSERVAWPYAQSIFELGLEDNSFELWQAQLAAISLLVADREFAKILALRLLSPQKLYDFAVSVIGSSLNDCGKNLLKLLIQHQRLNITFTIAELLKDKVAKHRNVQIVTVETARELSEDQLAKLAQTLKKNLGQNVQLEQELKPDLIGGGIIRWGNQVAENSVHAWLNSLKTHLTH